MEKVIQIHLSGMVFTIEEHAYQVLKDYLNKLKVHFTAHPEIVEDIETRMSELFALRLGSIRQTLFMADIEAVINTLGTIDQLDDSGKENKENKTSQTNIPPIGIHKKLRRNPNNQSLGGVCSGLAHFFDVDPVLIRVLFVVLLIVYGGGVLLYLILWIAVPLASGPELDYMISQQQNQQKRLFRDGDNRVVGGVAAGLSSYFGIDRAWVRIGFIVSILFFGTGFWLYIILWIITPKAVTASEKLQMRGESVDIHSIRNEYLEGANPNRISSIATHGSNLFSILIKGFFKLMTIALAVVLFGSIIAVSIAMVAVFLNLGEATIINELIELTIKDNSLIYAVKTGILLTLLMPLIALLLIVIRALFHTKFINRVWAITIGSLFMIGALLVAYGGFSFANRVKHTESRSNYQKVKADTLYLKGIEMPFPEDGENDETEMEIAFQDKGILLGKDAMHIEVSDIKIRETKQDSITLKVVFRANGRNEKDAEEHMEMIVFSPVINGNEITIPSYFSIPKSGQFVWQEVEITLLIPEGTVVVPDEISKEILDDENLDEADGSYYIFENGNLRCLDCEYNEEAETDSEKDDSDQEINVSIGDKNDPVKMKIKINEDEIKVEKNTDEEVEKSSKKRTDRNVKEK